MRTPSWLLVRSVDAAPDDFARLRHGALHSALRLEAWMERHSVTPPRQLEVIVQPARPHVAYGRCQAYNRATRFDLLFASDRPSMESEMLGHEFAHVAYLRALDSMHALPDEPLQINLLLHVLSEYVAVWLMGEFVPEPSELPQLQLAGADWWQAHLRRYSTRKWRSARRGIIANAPQQGRRIAQVLGSLAYTAASYRAAGRDETGIWQRTGLPR